MKKRILFIIFLVNCILNLPADEFQPATVAEDGNNITFYAGINPFALIAFLPHGIGTAVTGFGVISGQEFGISVYGGMHFLKSHSSEMRFSTGPADAVTWDTQLQIGYIWYPFEQFLDWKGGLTSGIMLRQFFWNNRITDYLILNFTPELLLGWRFNVKSIAFDLRGGWNFASITWSNMPHTKASTGWTPFPYNLTFIAGIAWVFN